MAHLVRTPKWLFHTYSVGNVPQTSLCSGSHAPTSSHLPCENSSRVLLYKFKTIYKIRRGSRISIFHKAKTEEKRVGTLRVRPLGELLREKEKKKRVNSHRQGKKVRNVTVRWFLPAVKVKWGRSAQPNRRPVNRESNWSKGRRAAQRCLGAHLCGNEPPGRLETNRHKPTHAEMARPRERQAAWSLGDENFPSGQKFGPSP